MAQRPLLCTFTRSGRRSSTLMSPTTLAVARRARSCCTSTTATLTGPSPKIWSTSAPLNLMFDCISTPAAAISPSSSATGGGHAPVALLAWRRARMSVHASVRRTRAPRTGRPSNRNLWSSDMELRDPNVGRWRSADLLQALREPAGVGDVVGRVAGDRLRRRVVERADHAGRRADDERVVRELLVLGHDAARADDAIAADLRAVQDHRAIAH